MSREDGCTGSGCALVGEASSKVTSISEVRFVGRISMADVANETRPPSHCPPWERWGGAVEPESRLTNQKKPMCKAVSRVILPM